MPGLEPGTSSLPRKCSTAELHWLVILRSERRRLFSTCLPVNQVVHRLIRVQIYGLFRILQNFSSIILRFSPLFRAYFPPNCPEVAGASGAGRRHRSCCITATLYTAQPHQRAPESPMEHERAPEVRLEGASRGLETLSHRRSGRQPMVEPAEGSPRRVLGGQVRPLPALGLGASGLAEHRRRG